MLSISEETKASDFDGNSLVTHLRLHELVAGLCTRDDPDIPDAIVRETEIFRASLLVMGGYGHSRLREFVFGGVTRHILREMKVPVLMAH